jgi:asparagine synthase (glutamine-hydrolysing)
MAGICGWFGTKFDAGEDVLNGMLRSMTRFDHAPPSSISAAGFGLGAAGQGSTALVGEHRGVRIALIGHVSWDGAPQALIGEAFLRQLVEAYLSQGPGAISRLGGDFSVAIMDLPKRRALLAIDRMGIRNLVFQLRDSTLVFGPTSDVVGAHPLIETTVDPQALYNYVYFHMVPGPGTVYREQHRLLPGHYALLEDGSLTVRPYWEMHFEGQEREPVAELKNEFLAALGKGVHAYALDDHCGSFLSGGTDSSTVAGLLGREQGSPARTYSIGFAAEGYDELGYARLASRHFKTDYHEYYVTPEDVVDMIPRLADVYDQPFGNASAIPTYYCARMAAADGVTRMLAGDGGDELYGGNSRYAKQYQFSIYDRIPGLLRRLAIEPALLALPENAGPKLLRKARSYVAQASVPLPARYESYNLLERLGPQLVFTAEFLARVDRDAPLALVNSFHERAHAQHWLNRLLAVDLKFTLADNDLPKVTRMCELAGVDVAFPLLHESVVDFSARLAPEMKLKGTRLRYFFKEALRDFLPQEIITKEKHGFGLPVGPWLASYAPLRNLARDKLESLKGRNIIRSEFIDQLLGEYLSQHPGYYGAMVWVLMMLELWFQNHVDASRSC